jgi:hypothetical protein
VRAYVRVVLGRTMEALMAGAGRQEGVVDSCSLLPDDWLAAHIFFAAYAGSSDWEIQNLI